ncbi:hypothetical protein ABIA39_003931 [Nocardia sp. GAS34]|uniref:helix-turn-helix domain-containing protein n=1 Tax=unclassified Nocardia TaxID=2637762 RepID=UPI003D19C3BB
MLLARELNVSIRTLQRAFASEGESVNAYIRRRRLEAAKLALTASPDRLTISELAAYWQFSDSSQGLANPGRGGQAAAVQALGVGALVAGVAGVGIAERGEAATSSGPSRRPTASRPPTTPRHMPE